MASQLQGNLQVPQLRWKYALMKPIIGWKAAKWAQMTFPKLRDSLLMSWDKATYKFGTHEDDTSQIQSLIRPNQDRKLKRANDNGTSG